MFSFRQILRCGIRLPLTREPINLHQLPFVQKGRYDVSVYERTFIHTKTNLCESAQDTKEDTKEDANKNVPGKIERKMKLLFTCKKCNYRNSKIISKLAYEKGVIIVRCDGCKNNHLIADNLGWFQELKNKNNIEKLLAEKGETVRKVLNDVDGYIEVVAKAEFDMIEHNKCWEQHVIEAKGKTCVEHNKNGTSDKT